METPRSCISANNKTFLFFKLRHGRNLVLKLLSKMARNEGGAEADLRARKRRLQGQLVSSSPRPAQVHLPQVQPDDKVHLAAEHPTQ